MVKNLTQLPIKLLLNAESFGFGPTAAIADLFPYFRESFSYLGYVGSGHTLDLQKSFPYDEIIDLSGQDPSAFNEVVEKYDFFFTALNFDKAERAAALGCPTIIYDSLTWFWPKIPPVVAKKNVLYLAQNFHGVKERIENEADCFGQHLTVSPFTKRVPREPHPNILLLNMGGLINPFWPSEYYIKYAQAMIQAVKNSADPDLDLQIVCSSQVAKLLPDENIRTYNRDQIFSILPKVKIAIQTPGLANIYEGAAYQFPTLFLPPANDSQGQQLDLLRNHGQVDAFIDWEQLPKGKKIQYRGEQLDVLQQIGQQITYLTEKETFHSLSALMKNGIEKLMHKTSLCLPTLLDQYGYNGAEQVAEIVKLKMKGMLPTYV